MSWTMSETKAHRRNPLEEEIIQILQPSTCTGCRFRVFLEYEIEKAIHDQGRQRSSNVPSCDPVRALTIDTLVISDALTPSKTPYAPILTRKAIKKMRGEGV